MYILRAVKQPSKLRHAARKAWNCQNRAFRTCLECSVFFHCSDINKHNTGICLKRVSFKDKSHALSSVLKAFRVQVWVMNSSVGIVSPCCRKHNSGQTFSETSHWSLKPFLLSLPITPHPRQSPFDTTGRHQSNNCSTVSHQSQTLEKACFVFEKVLRKPRTTWLGEE